MGDKIKPAYYTVDFVTALPLTACRERLEHEVILKRRTIGEQLAPLDQQTTLRENGAFVVERTFPGAMHPIRLAGNLDHDEASGGTWVHGTITHDTYNQVLVEGMIIFLVFFMISAVFFVRLKEDGLLCSIPLLLMLLGVASLRWRALRKATEDLAHWMRRQLYVTRDQVREK
ncbi:MAG: hypothetical protein HY866_07835 [Chloroflexi bacterium]|nr:hypothetical protein [Chloroflexota bacterium]